MMGRFAASDRGAVLTETIIAVPLLTVLAVGMLEFGNMLWQRHQLQVGVRDAARYWARCRPIQNGGAFMPCSQAIARNLAFYGNPTGTGAVRIPGWDNATELTITPATPPTVPTAASLVVATGTFPYQGSPLISVLGLGTIELSYTYTLRYNGW